MHDAYLRQRDDEEVSTVRGSGPARRTGGTPMRDERNGCGPDDEHAVGRRLGRAAKAARAYHEQRLAAAGSSFATWTALFALRRRGPLIQRRLAELLGVEGPTLTRHLARMEAEGLVERRRTSEDRRAALVRLTERGEETYERLAGIVRAGADTLLRGFSEREVEEFTGYLDRLIAYVGAAAPPRRAGTRDTVS
jgi:MarR family transcriptional regulator for hemolysin